VLIQIGSSATSSPLWRTGWLSRGHVGSYLFIARPPLGMRSWPTCHKPGFATLKRRWWPRELSKRQGRHRRQFIRAMVEATHYLKTRPATACEYWADIHALTMLSN